jgi:hypothetical protein
MPHVALGDELDLVPLLGRVAWRPNDANAD